MELLNSIKQQRELFSKTLTTTKMPSKLDFETKFRLTPATGQKTLNNSPRKKAEVSDTRQLVSSLRSKREDLKKRLENPPSTTHGNLGGENLGKDHSRLKQKAVVDLSLLGSEKSAHQGNDSLQEKRDSTMRVKSFQDRINTTDKPSKESTASERMANINAGSTEHFEKRSPDNDESAERRSVSNEVKRRSALESWRKPPDERDAAFQNKLGGSKSSLERFPATEYLLKTACRKPEQNLSASNNPTFGGSCKQRYENPEDCPAPATRQRKSSLSEDSSSFAMRQGKMSSSDDEDRKSKPLDISWIKKPENEDLSTRKNGTIDSSWIKKTAEDSHSTAKSSRSTNEEQIKHNIPNQDSGGGNTGTARTTLVDQVLKEGPEVSTSGSEHASAVQRVLKSSLRHTEQTKFNQTYLNKQTSANIANKDSCNGTMARTKIVGRTLNEGTDVSTNESEYAPHLHRELKSSLKGTEQLKSKQSYLSKHLNAIPNNDLASCNFARTTLVDKPLKEEPKVSSNESGQARAFHKELKSSLKSMEQTKVKQAYLSKQCNTGAHASPEVKGKRKYRAEPPWITKPEMQESCSMGSVKQKIALPCDDPNKHKARQTAAATPSWIKQNAALAIRGFTPALAFKVDPQKQTKHMERTTTANSTYNNFNLPTTNAGSTVSRHTRRNTVGDTFFAAKAGLQVKTAFPAKAVSPAKAKHDVSLRRKSGGDVSWIKKKEDHYDEANAIPEPPVEGASLPPWFLSAKQANVVTVTESTKNNLIHKNNLSDQHGRVGVLSPFGEKRRLLSESARSFPANKQTESVGWKVESNDERRDEPENENNHAHPDEPENSMALSENSLVFVSAKARPFSTGKDVKVVLPIWQAPGNYQDSDSIIRATAQSTINVPNLARAKLEMNAAQSKVSFAMTLTSPTKRTKISSLIDMMEKFSQGKALAASEDSLQAEDAPEINEEANSIQSEARSPTSQALSPASSTENSLILEYGEAGFLESGFIFASEDDWAYKAPDQCHLLDESEEASVGSTYKADNYQKDFNEVIPIPNTCMHTAPCTSFESFAQFLERDILTIVSIAPNTTLLAPSFVDDTEVDYVEPTCQQDDEKRDQRLDAEKSLATRHTRHHVARNSLLSAGKRCHRRSMSVDCIGGPDVDPIFQVKDDTDRKSGMRGIKAFLSKPKEEGDFTLQEESKPNSSMGMFSLLRKGLGTSSSRKSDDTKGEYVEDVTDEISLDNDDCYHDRAGSDSRTAISSITRSVISNPGDSLSCMSAESKPAMPLGVLNGFLKAARKLQKKSRRKQGRGRSLSKPPLEGFRRPNHDSKPTTVSVPHLELQVWPNDQISDPATVVAAMGGRRFGTYGGLLYASSRSRALEVPVPAIQSLASW